MAQLAALILAIAEIESAGGRYKGMHKDRDSYGYLGVTSECIDEHNAATKDNLTLPDMDDPQLAERVFRSTVAGCNTDTERAIRWHGGPGALRKYMQTGAMSVEMAHYVKRVLDLAEDYERD